MTQPPEFQSFQKIPRLSRDIVVTEKLDGTNAQVTITEDGDVFAGSRSRWVTPQEDNFGFAAWVEENKEDLRNLGPGTHYGEWWGQGIQRKYGMDRKVFSLFNVSRWEDPMVRPACCDVVPVLYRGPFSTPMIDNIISGLRVDGSVASPGFMNPEGIIIFHTQGNLLFKKTLVKDELPKFLTEKNAA